MATPGKEATAVVSLPHNLHQVRRAHRDVQDLPHEHPTVSPLYPTLFIDSKFWTEVLTMFASSSDTTTNLSCPGNHQSEVLGNEGVTEPVPSPLTRSNVNVADNMDYLHRQVFAKFIAASGSPNGKGLRPAGIRQVLHQIGVPCSSAMANALVQRMHYITLDVRSLIRERTETSMSVPQAQVDTLLACVSHAMATRLAADVLVNPRNSDSVRSVDGSPSPIKQNTNQLKSVSLSTPDFLSSRLKGELLIKRQELLLQSSSPRTVQPLRTSSPLTASARGGGVASECSTARDGEKRLRYSPSSVVRSSVDNTSSVVPPTRASILRSDAGTRSPQRDVNGRARSPTPITGGTRNGSPAHHRGVRHDCHDISNVTHRSSLASRDTSPAPSLSSPSRQRTLSPRKAPSIGSPVTVGFNADYHQKIVEVKFSHVQARVQHLNGTVFLHRQDENPFLPATSAVSRRGSSPVGSQVKSPTLHHSVLAKPSANGNIISRSLHREMATASLPNSTIHSLPSVPQRVSEVPLPHSKKPTQSHNHSELEQSIFTVNQLLRTDNEVRCYTKAPTDLMVTVEEDPVIIKAYTEAAPTLVEGDGQVEQLTPRREKLTRTDDEVRMHSPANCWAPSPLSQQGIELPSGPLPPARGVAAPSQHEDDDVIAAESKLLWNCRPVDRDEVDRGFNAKDHGAPPVPNLAEEW